MLGTLVLTLAFAFGPQDGVQLTYLGNEGFLLEGGGRKVLIDALVSRRMRAYVDQDEELRARIEGALPPFDDVDLVLASHVHGDHFDADAVARHLAANPRALFLSTPQAVERMDRALRGSLGSRTRLRVARPSPDKPQRFEELSVEAFALHHGHKRKPAIQNLGWWIELGGLEFLHLGDTEVSADELGALNLAGRGTDVALVPSWYLDAAPWKGAIESALGPRHVIVMHLAPRWSSESRTTNQRESRARVSRIEEAYPRALLPRRALQQFRFDAQGALEPPGAPEAHERSPAPPATPSTGDGGMLQRAPKRSTKGATTCSTARPVVSSVSSQRP